MFQAIARKLLAHLGVKLLALLGVKYKLSSKKEAGLNEFKPVFYFADNDLVQLVDVFGAEKSGLFTCRIKS
jgi:hypothetical protein